MNGSGANFLSRARRPADTGKDPHNAFLYGEHNAGVRRLKDS